MSRAVHIPLGLWLCAAVVAHMLGGGGAVEVAHVVEDRAQLRRMVLSVREGLRAADTTYEVLTDGTEPTLPAEALSPPERAADDSAAESERDKDPVPEPTRKPEAVKPKKPEPPKATKTPPKTEPPKPEPPKEEVAKVAPVKVMPPLPAADHRLAVRQHVQKDQDDNKEANRIADDANKVAEETVAQIRSKDQDDPTPTPGSTSGPSGPKDRVGDSDQERSAQSEERAGDEKHAPGERKVESESESAEHHTSAPPSPVAASPLPSPARGVPSMPGAKAGGRLARAAGAEALPNRGAAGGAGPASPEIADGARSGGYSLNPANPGGDGNSRIAGRKVRPNPFDSPVHVGSLGLGAPGLPGGPNLNLTMAGVEQAVGHEQLKAERAADGASRRSAHRGSWETNKWEKWRAAIENYEPSVKPGNQTALNAARVPFATYINNIHNRLHPIFAEEFLASLDNLPPSHAFNQGNRGLVTHLEIVLSKDNGRIVRLGITKASGMTAFDIVALNSVSRASPFGKAPDAIVSPDGNVYLHWEFHRDPDDACTTRNARPFLLKEAPHVTPLDPAPARRPRPAPADEGAGSTGPLLPLRQ